MKKTLAAFLSFFFAIPPLHSGLLPDNAFSEDARGTTAASFLKNMVSARFYGLGQTGASLEGPENLFYNPAGMGLYGHKSGLFISYQSLLEGSYRTDFSYVRGGGDLYYGFGFVYNSYGVFDKQDDRGTVLEFFSPSDLALISGLSWEKSGLKYGADLKLIRENLIYEKAYSIAVDMGIVVLPDRNDKKEYSLTVRNLGLPMKLGTESDPLPLEIVGGLVYPYSDMLDVIFEGKFPSDDSPYAALGMEFVLPMGDADFALRSGFNFKNRQQLGFMGVFSAGFGLNIRGLGLDYAFVPYGDLGETHRISFSWLLGRHGKKKDEDFCAVVRKQMMAKKKFAVLDFSAGGISENYGSLIANNIELALDKAGWMTVPRDGFDFIMAAGEIPPPYDGQGAGTLCQTVKADYCVYGEVKRVDEGIAFKVQLYDAADGKTVRSFTVLAPDEYRFNPVSEKIAEEITTVSSRE